MLFTRPGKFVFPAEEWDGISQEGKDFVSLLMSKLPGRRPSAKEALEHPWFAQALGLATPVPPVVEAEAAAAPAVVEPPPAPAAN